MTLKRVDLDTDTGEIIHRPEPRDFAGFLVEHHRGTTNDEISHAFQDLLEAVTTHGKKGSLTLKIGVDPTSASEGSPVSILIEHEVKPPKESPTGAVFFVNKDIHPVRDNPMQMGFEFRPAPETTPMRGQS